MVEFVGKKSENRKKQKKNCFALKKKATPKKENMSNGVFAFPAAGPVPSISEVGGKGYSLIKLCLNEHGNVEFPVPPVRSRIPSSFLFFSFLFFSFLFFSFSFLLLFFFLQLLTIRYKIILLFTIRDLFSGLRFFKLG